MASKTERTIINAAGLARRITTKRVYLLGLACSTVSMVLLLASTLVKSEQAAAYRCCWWPPRSWVNSLYRKLGTSSRSQAIPRARQLGLLEG
jgi:hypothetical protein